MIALVENKRCGQAQQRGMIFVRMRRKPCSSCSCAYNGRCTRAQRTAILLERTRRRPCLSWSHIDRTIGAREHNKQELFSRGREEDPIHHSCVRIEREAQASTMKSNASWEDKNKTPFIVIARRENGRRPRKMNGMLLNWTIRRPRLKCSLLERTRGLREYD